MATNITSNELMTAQDKKINQLLSSIGAPVLAAYLRQVVRGQVHAKEREKALLILGMIVYKTNPPVTINYNALYEFIPLLNRYVKQLELQQREDAKTPATRSIIIEDESAVEDEEEQYAEWEAVDTMPRESGVAPADGGKRYFESPAFRPRLMSQESSSSSSIAKVSAEWDSIDLSTPVATKIPEASSNSAVAVTENNQELGDKSWFSAGADLIKAVVKAIPFQTPFTDIPVAELEKQFQEMIKALTATPNLERHLRDVIGGFADAEKRGDALLILGIVSFLYGFNGTGSVEFKATKAGDSALLYSYIGMMRKYIGGDLHSGWTKEL